MKKSSTFCAMFVFVLFAAFMFLAILEAEGNDKSVKGLWVEVPKFPEKAEVVGLDESDADSVSYTRVLDAGVVLLVERLKNIGDGGEDITPEGVRKFVAAAEGIDETEIDATENMEGVAERYSYPVSGVEYSTGKNEDTRKNVDLLLFTDEWVFRVHISVGADFFEDYERSRLQNGY